MAQTVAPKPVVDHDDPFADTRMSIGDHIEELRSHLFRAIYGLVVAIAIALWPIGPYAFAFITKPVEDQLQEFFDRQEKREEEKFLADRHANKSPLKLELRIDRQALRDAVNDAAPPKKRPPVLDKMAPGLEELRRVLEQEEPKGEEKEEPRPPFVVLPAEIDDAAQLFPFFREADRVLRPRRLSAMSVQEVFLVYMQVALLVGFVIASPWVFYQLWSFVAAGLYPTEKKLVNVYMPFSIFLFLAGFVVCEWMAIPNAIRGLLWFNEWLGINPEIRLNEWLGFALILPLVFGISFQTPLVMLFLHKLGIVDVPGFVAFRSYAWFGMAAVVIIFAPIGDLQSLLLLWGPMCALYELGILICRFQPPRPVDDFDESELDSMIGV
jgi:sec-independent protein translocase protein TatC